MVAVTIFDLQNGNFINSLYLSERLDGTLSMRLLVTDPVVLGIDIIIVARAKCLQGLKEVDKVGKGRLSALADNSCEVKSSSLEVIENQDNLMEENE